MVLFNQNLQLLISDTSSFTYYHRPEYATVMLDDILYFNSEGRKIHMVTTNGCDSFYYKLDEVEQLLQQKDHLLQESTNPIWSIPITSQNTTNGR